MTVHFIGAGPGDPELLTVRAMRLIQTCPVILYAGSLIPEAIVELASPEALRVNTAGLNLDEIIAQLCMADRQGKDVARLHSGDPALYGAVAEQWRRLEEQGIDCQIIPGVNAFSASAAELGRELTVPGLVQTVILTRYQGKVPMPEGEQLTALARHRATLAIHLGVVRLPQIVAELMPHYGPDCPVAVCYRVSQPEQRIFRGRLDDIVRRVQSQGIHRSALVLVGRALQPQGAAESWLYQEGKAHIFRPRGRRRKSVPGASPAGAALASSRPPQKVAGSPGKSPGQSSKSG